MHSLNISIKPTLGVLAVISLFVVSCQKKFDANSYKPAESFDGYSSADQIESAALVAHFAFENNLVDSVSNTAATNYGTTFGTGIKGQALQVGLNNYAIFTPTSGITGLQSMTISFWMNTPEDTLGIQEPVGFVDSNQFWSNLDMYLDGQNASGCTFKIHCFGNSGASEAWLTSWTLTNPWNVWTQIALTYDATANNFIFYVNGTQVGISNMPNFGPLNFSNFPAIVFGTNQFQTVPSLTSGATSQPWASYLLGEMDELRIYNKALSGTEVNALYQLENNGF